jgi:hypothetical protein
MLLKRNKAAAWGALIVGVLLLILAAIVCNSRYYANCIDGRPDAIGLKDVGSKNYHPAPTITSGFTLYKQCIGGAISHFNAVITALSTMLLTFVTGGLVWMGYLQISTTRAQLRAYLFLKSAGLYDGTTIAPPDPLLANVPIVHAQILNSGQTPAFLVHSFMAIEVIEPINEHTLTAPPIDKTKKRNALGAGDLMPKNAQYGHALTQSQISDLVAGVKRVYLYGRIDYFTLGRWRSTEFRLGYAGVWPPSPNMAFIFSEHGNEAD